MVGPPCDACGARGTWFPFDNLGGRMALCFDHAPKSHANPGARIGQENREAVRAFFAGHVGCTNVECGKALGLSAVAVGRHVATLRKEWTE